MNDEGTGSLLGMARLLRAALSGETVRITVRVGGRRRAARARIAPAGGGAALLCETERAVVRHLSDGRREPMPAIRDGVEQSLGRLAPEGQLKTLLARLVAVGVLENSKSASPPGYRLTEKGRACAG